jgi:hypothetical protein
MAASERPDVWHGRLATGLDPRARALNDSLAVDRQLWPEELLLSRAYARALVEASVLAEDECQALLEACDQLERELGEGRVELTGEDVHSAIEAELTARAGAAGRKLHTGRSRNDQVATLLRLRVMALCGRRSKASASSSALVQQARAVGNSPSRRPHLQPAQLRLRIGGSRVVGFERDEGVSGRARGRGSVPLGAAPSRTPSSSAARIASASASRLPTSTPSAIATSCSVPERGGRFRGSSLRLAEDLVLWCSPASVGSPG